MAEVNEIVRYGAQGICRIQQIEEKSIGASLPALLRAQTRVPRGLDDLRPRG